MPRFFTGDELGSVKSVLYTQDAGSKEWKSDVKVISGTPGEAKPISVQKVAFSSTGADKVLAAARADGTVGVYRVQDDETTDVFTEWKETRLKQGQRYAGLSILENRIFSCTSNGALRVTTLGEEKSGPSAQTSVLPMRLRDWRLSRDGQTFAYGGDEVELSVWDTESAFAPRDKVETSDIDTKKRKRGDQLLPGEIWRAKNVPNDGLSLRQPVHNTSLTYLQPSSSASQHLLAGTRHGHIRRYDTRAARRPVADWKGIGKVGGARTVEKGFAEHEVFVSDNGSSLLSLDLRNGRVVYGYKGIAGAVSSVAPAPSLLASVAQDRFLCLHSTFPPPKEAGQQQEQKGEVLDKLYMKAIPTVVVWDQSEDSVQTVRGDETEEGEADDDDVWDAMEDAEDDEDAEGGRKGKKKSRIAA